MYSVVRTIQNRFLLVKLLAGIIILWYSLTFNDTECTEGVTWRHTVESGGIISSKYFIYGLSHKKSQCHFKRVTVIFGKNVILTFWKLLHLFLASVFPNLHYLLLLLFVTMYLRTFWWLNNGFELSTANSFCDSRSLRFASYLRWHEMPSLRLSGLYQIQCDWKIRRCLRFASLKQIKVKVKLYLCFFLTEHHVMQAYWRSGGIAPRILDLGTRCRRVVGFTSRPLYAQRTRWCPLDRRLGEPQSRTRDHNMGGLHVIEKWIHY
jgi:hypothetical protein